MAEKFIGAQVRAGQFTSKDNGQLINYNNLVLFGTSKVNCGDMCNDPIKIANNGENLIKVFGRPISMDWLRSKLGQYMCVFYDKYKKVERVMFFEEDPDKDLYTPPESVAAPSALPTEVVNNDNGGLTEDSSLPAAGAEILDGKPSGKTAKEADGGKAAK